MIWFKEEPKYTYGPVSVIPQSLRSIKIETGKDGTIEVYQTLRGRLSFF